MKKCLQIILAFLLTATFGAAAQIGGQSAYNFLDISGSTRIYGLGGVNISTVDGDDVMTTDQNPARLGPEMPGNLGI